MIELIVTLVALLIPQHAIDGIGLTAPKYLDIHTAREHLASALVAGIVTDTEPTLLLAIAYNESRYQPTAIGPEARGLVSCGVMTPEPVARCPPTMTAIDGYLAGARHLRRWLDQEHDETRALFGYAGGGRLIRACANGGPRCYAPSMFRRRALWIRRSIASQGARS